MLQPLHKEVFFVVMNTIEIPSNRNLEPGLRVPVFSMEDVLGIHTTHRELEPDKNDFLIDTVSFTPDSIDSHLGLFIAGVLGDLSPDAIDENGTIRMHRRTVRVIEDFEVHYQRHLPDTDVVLHVFPPSQEETTLDACPPDEYDVYLNRMGISLIYSDGMPLQNREDVYQSESERIE